MSVLNGVGTAMMKTSLFSGVREARNFPDCTAALTNSDHNLVNKLRKRVLALVDGQIVKDEACGTYAYE